MTIYGYSSERPGGIFTHVFDCHDEAMDEMEDHSYRYDNRSIKNCGSFIHFTKEDRDEFINRFNIILVDHKNELKTIKKLMNST